MVSNREEAIELLLTMADTAKELAEFFGGGNASSPAETAAEKPLTLEEVRAELSKLSRAGKTHLVKQILGKFNASKLSDVNPADYWPIMAMAQEVNGTTPEARHA